MRSISTILIIFVAMSLNPIPVVAQKKIESYPKDIIYFGKGGGFTGIETTYALLESGDLYKKQTIPDQGYQFIKRLKPEETKQVFSNYEFLGLGALQLNDPGNTYTFIEYSNKTSNNKLTWGGTDSLPGNLKLFYSILNHHVAH